MERCRWEGRSPRELAIVQAREAEKGETTLVNQTSIYNSGRGRGHAAEE